MTILEDICTLTLTLIRLNQTWGSILRAGFT